MKIVTLKKMTWNMKEKFHSIGLALETILEPLLKVDFIKYCYKTLNLLTYKDKTKKVIEKFKMLTENMKRNYLSVVFLFSNHLMNPS